MLTEMPNVCGVGEEKRLTHQISILQCLLWISSCLWTREEARIEISTQLETGTLA